ncbi:soluble NSF attachment protein receptor, partial [Ochromonadaceae sp. CCMP2298]
MNREEDREPLLNMSSQSFEADPFYTVRDNVHAQVERLKVRHDKFQQLCKTTDTSADAEFKDLRKNLVKELRTAEKDLKGLQGAVEMIEKNRGKFPLITDNELTNRRAFTGDTKTSIAAVRSGLDSVAVRQKIDSDLSKGVAEYSTNPMANDNAAFVSGQSQRTQHMIQQQDESLESLGQAVDRLGTIGRDINEEVREQSVLLDSLGNEVDEAGAKMDVVTASLSKLLKTKDNCQIWTIVFLTFVLILL